MNVDDESLRGRLAALCEDVNAELDAGRRLELRAEIAECRRRLEPANDPIACAVAKTFGARMSRAPQTDKSK